ncbi:hypothetical protein M9194_06540 [Vibrio sp. S4M6]|uniref:hypothetical protein n=1 Tax=Vibrio sinus TaxID=2946865 RepID=UPI00202A3F4E|nr:hypothetical protein [Vibrio sinus]MCL9781083.1 hypothetical protein [Vibrio sinus]
MTVMNNMLDQSQSRYSKAEIDAARNAFVRNERNKQVHLLTVMPMDEALAILQTSPDNFVKELLDELKEHGHHHHARYFASQLGLSKNQLSLDWLNARIALASVALIGAISGISTYILYG